MASASADGVWEKAGYVFGLVREDPLVELAAVEALAARRRGASASASAPEPPFRVFCIASGGCTALSLLATPLVGKVDTFDINHAQVFLTELRRLAAKHLSVEEQLRLFEFNLATEEERVAVFRERLLPLLHDSDLRQFWTAREKDISYGVNRAGGLERQMAVTAMLLQKETGIDPVEDREAGARLSESGEELFRDILDRNTAMLTLHLNFVENIEAHIRFQVGIVRTILRGNKKYSPKDNYFLHTYWKGCYPPGWLQVPDRVPPYLQQRHEQEVKRKVDALSAYPLDLKAGLQWAQRQGLLYDFIQISNVTDMIVNDQEKREIFGLMDACLAPGGAVLVRRLFGKFDLRPLVAQYFDIDDALSMRLQDAERTGLYEVVAAYKRP